MAIGVNYELIWCCRNSIDIKIVIFLNAVIKMRDAAFGARDAWTF